MNLKIKSMSLANFNGVRERVINFYDRTEIVGLNGAGKTSILDAWVWLLVGKDSGFNSFNPTPVNEKGEWDITGETIVESKVMLDGKDVVLKKIHSPKNVKKRGDATKTFSGFTTKYYIDGIEHKKSEYEEWIEKNIASAHILQPVVDIFYFVGKLDWRKRRETLIELAGGEVDIVEAGRELAKTAIEKEVHSRLAGFGLDKTRKWLIDLKKKYNEVLTTKPAVIEELRNSLSQDMLPSRGQIESEIEKKESEIAELRELIKTPSDDLTKRRTFLARHLFELENKLQEVRELYAKADSQLAKARLEINFMENELNSLQSKMNDLENVRPAIKSVCDCCGQPIPESEIEKVKSIELRKINTKKEEYAQRIEDIRNSLELKRKEIQSLTDNKTSIASERDSVLDEINSLRVRISELDSEFAEQGRREASKIAELSTEITELKKILTDIEKQEEIIERIHELEKEIKESGQKLASVMQGIDYLDTVVLKTSEETERIVNKLFDKVRWKLFEKQVNGDYKPICEAYYLGNDGVLVPFSKASFSQKIAIGAEVSNKLADFYRVNTPLFIDNAESIINMEIPTPANRQLILLRAGRPPKGEIESRNLKDTSYIHG